MPLPPGISVRRCAVFVGALIALSSGVTGCSDDRIAGVGHSLPLTLTPSALSFSPGDSTMARANTSAPFGGATRLHWTSAHPSLMRVDTVVGPGEYVVLRALAPDSTADVIEVTGPGFDPSIVTLPVQITALP